MVVVPAAALVTVPAVLMLATVTAELVQLPPGVKSDKLLVLSLHNMLAPDIAAGTGYTVTVALADVIPSV